MARRDERMTEAHPADDQLDRLRAGLIGPSHPVYPALRAHVETCGHCQVRDRTWARIGDRLDRGAHEPGLAARLRARRERALRGEGTGARAPRRAIAAFATFVVATLALGLGSWTYVERHESGTRIVSAREGDAVPDLYADIDFYLWLLEREAANRSPNG